MKYIVPSKLLDDPQQIIFKIIHVLCLDTHNKCIGQLDMSVSLYASDKTH